MSTAPKAKTTVKALISAPEKPAKIYSKPSSKIVVGGTEKPSKVYNKAPAQKNPADDINAYLTGNTDYQSSVAAINQALADYRAQNASDSTGYDIQYAQNVYDDKRQNALDMDNLSNDYAGRGLLRSGLYGTALGRLSDSQASTLSNLDIARNTYKQGLTTNLYNFQQQQNLALQQARQQAIKQRALALLQSG